jgi:hypothetical protein
MVVGAQARCAFRLAALGQGQRVHCIDQFTAGRLESGHLAIAWCMGEAVERRTDQE